MRRIIGRLFREDGEHAPRNARVSDTRSLLVGANLLLSLFPPCARSFVFAHGSAYLRRSRQDRSGAV